MWALWGIVNLAPEAISSGGFTFLKAGPITLQTSLVTMLFCWCITEVLRYGFYAAKVWRCPCIIHHFTTWRAHVCMPPSPLRSCTGLLTLDQHVAAVSYAA
jgi:hypothetical protein